jgi:hypothetical protein
VEPESVPDLFADRPLVIMGKYNKADGRIVVTGRSGNGEFRSETRVAPQMDDSRNKALMYLWARERIARLADYGKVGVNVQADVTALGLKYGLMTEYTSFVAVDKEVRGDGRIVTVKQPLPLPEGVSNYAVGELNVSQSIMYKSVAPNGNGFSQAGGLYPRMADKGKKTEHDALALSVDELEASEPAKAQASGGPVYLADAKLPDGVDINLVEKAVVNAVQADLQKYFAANNLTGLKLELKVKTGKVESVKVVSTKGGSAPQKAIEDIMAKVRLGSVTGTVVVEMEAN